MPEPDEVTALLDFADKHLTDFPDMLTRCMMSGLVDKARARLAQEREAATALFKSAEWTLKYDFITDRVQRQALQDVVNDYRAAVLTD